MRNLKRNLLALAILAGAGGVAPAAFAQDCSGIDVGAGQCAVWMSLNYTDNTTNTTNNKVNLTLNNTFDEQDWIRNYVLNSVSYIYSDVVYISPVGSTSPKRMSAARAEPLAARTSQLHNSIVRARRISMDG